MNRKSIRLQLVEQVLQKSIETLARCGANFCVDSDRREITIHRFSNLWMDSETSSGPTYGISFDVRNTSGSVFLHRDNVTRFHMSMPEETE